MRAGSAPFVIVELSPGRRVDVVKTFRDVDQRFANGHVMQAVRVERFEDKSNQPRAARNHHYEVAIEVCADEVNVNAAYRVSEEVPSLHPIA
ncbi:hypothetical protein ACQKGO_24040 [Corallococcus interemptor]|uniref:hypothetical protein n=1 Tax=Corallococcus interemptor TaxID=2316720 RepID=UPI003D007EE5